MYLKMILSKVSTNWQVLFKDHIPSNNTELKNSLGAIAHPRQSHPRK